MLGADESEMPFLAEEHAITSAARKSLKTWQRVRRVRAGTPSASADPR